MAGGFLFCLRVVLRLTTKLIKIQNKYAVLQFLVLKCNKRLRDTFFKSLAPRRRLNFDDDLSVQTSLLIFFTERAVYTPIFI